MTTTERFLALRAPVHASVSADGDRLAVTVTWVERSCEFGSCCSTHGSGGSGGTGASTFV